MSILSRIVDERFLAHRRVSTSIAGVTGAAAAMGLFTYRYYVDHVWSWDLFAIGVTIVVVKLALMAWYLVTD